MLYNWNDTIKTSVRTSFVLSFLLQTLQRNRHFCPEGFQGMYIVIKLEMLNFNCSATCLDKDRDCWESKIVLMIWLFRFYKLGNFSYTSLLATLLFSLVLQLAKNLLDVGCWMLLYVIKKDTKCERLIIPLRAKRVGR